MASESSAKAGSKVFRGNGSPPCTLSLADSRKDDRDERRSGVVGRIGVVGRELRVCEVDRFTLNS